MKPLIVLILCAAWGLRAADAPLLSAVQKVYVLPMTSGLDQYLAERLAAEGVFKVVVDPKQADAIWSERVDAGFTKTMDELYPPPKPPADKGKDAKPEDAQPQAPRRSAGRSRGNLFLVGIASRQVIWSGYRKLDDTSSKGLHRAAAHYVKQIKKDLAGKE